MIFGLVENTPFLDNGLIEHLLPRKLYRQFFALVFDREFNSLRLKQFSTLERNLAFISRLKPHKNIASIILDPVEANDLLVEVKSPLLHVLLARLVFHHVSDELGCLLNFYRGVRPARNLDLCIRLAFFHKLIINSYEPAHLRCQVNHLVPFRIKVHEHRLAQIGKLYLVSKL